MSNHSETLVDLVENVVDENTFLDFILLLSQDRKDEAIKEKRNPSAPYGPGCNGWENGSIETFLEAAHAFGVATKSTASENNPWKRAAKIIYGGKYYE